MAFEIQYLSFEDEFKTRRLRFRTPHIELACAWCDAINAVGLDEGEAESVLPASGEPSAAVPTSRGGGAASGACDADLPKMAAASAQRDSPAA